MNSKCTSADTNLNSIPNISSANYKSVTVYINVIHYYVIRDISIISW